MNWYDLFGDDTNKEVTPGSVLPTQPTPVPYNNSADKYSALINHYNELAKAQPQQDTGVDWGKIIAQAAAGYGNAIALGAGAQAPNNVQAIGDSFDKIRQSRYQNALDAWKTQLGVAQNEAGLYKDQAAIDAAKLKAEREQKTAEAQAKMYGAKGDLATAQAGQIGQLTPYQKQRLDIERQDLAVKNAKAQAYIDNLKSGGNMSPDKIANMSAKVMEFASDNGISADEAAKQLNVGPAFSKYQDNQPAPATPSSTSDQTATSVPAASAELFKPVSASDKEFNKQHAKSEAELLAKSPVETDIQNANSMKNVEAAANRIPDKDFGSLSPMNITSRLRSQGSLTAAYTGDIINSLASTDDQKLVMSSVFARAAQMARQQNPTGTITNQDVVNAAASIIGPDASKQLFMNQLATERGNLESNIKRKQGIQQKHGLDVTPYEPHTNVVNGSNRKSFFVGGAQ